jgi:hypothetical protein
MNRNAPPNVTASAWTILIRLQVGLMVFFPEGIQKLVFPDILGAGRFAKIGIPFPDLMGPFVGCRNGLRPPPHHRPVHTARRDPADHHHDRRTRLDQTANPARP